MSPIRDVSCRRSHFEGETGVAVSFDGVSVGKRLLSSVTLEKQSARRNHMVYNLTVRVRV